MAFLVIGSLVEWTFYGKTVMWEYIYIYIYMFNQKNFYSNMWVLRARPLSHDWQKKKKKDTSTLSEERSGKIYGKERK